MRKLLNIIAFITLGLSFFLVLVVGFWLLYPYNPLVITKSPMPVFPHKVRAGESIMLQVDYCKNVDLPTSVSRSFVDEIIYVAPSITTNNPVGCHSIKANVSIPEGLPPQMYKIVQRYHYHVNPIRTVEIVSESEMFEITE